MSLQTAIDILKFHNGCNIEVTQKVFTQRMLLLMKALEAAKSAELKCQIQSLVRYIYHPFQVALSTTAKQLRKKPIKTYQKLICQRSAMYFVLAITCQLSFSATANNLYGEVLKDNGRYTVELEYDSQYSSKARLRCKVEQELCGFVDSAKVYLQWWTLFDQSVEFVSVEWKRGKQISWRDSQTGNMLTIKESELKQYPELLKKWKALKPIEMSFSVHVELNAGAVNYNRYVDNPNFLYQDNKFNFDIRARDGVVPPKSIPNLRASFVKLITPNHMIIGSEGTKSSDTSPISPQTWQQWLMFEPTSMGYRKVRDMPSKEFDKRLFNTFRLSNTATFGPMELESLKIPTSSLNAIYKALQIKQFESTEENDEQATDDFWNGDEAESLTETVDEQDIDDFWQGDESKSNVASNDRGKSTRDFWSGQGTNQEEISLEATIAKSTGNEYLGEFYTQGGAITLQYRDHGEIDGDRVQVWLNGEPYKSRVELQARFQSITIQLTPGVNRIAFEALNQGSSGNNTAEFKVLDAQSRELFSNQWSIDRGFRSTILVINEGQSN